MRRWLADEPVSAWREPLMVRTRRWMRRHQRLVAGAAAAVLVGTIAMAGLVAVVATANRTIERERDQAKDVTEFLVSSFRKPNPAQDGRTVTVARCSAARSKSWKCDRRWPRPRGPRSSTHNCRHVSRSRVGSGERGSLREDLGDPRVGSWRPDDPDTLISMNDLAVAYYDAGQFDRAIPLHEQAAREHGRRGWVSIIPTPFTR